ncbi:MAG: HAD family phosphatase [Eubacteriales bacterium]|nr:HAD family phosphatase [Eubacteriales bacterium]
MKITGAIFDLDGTLLDSMPYWESVGLRYLQEQNIQVMDAAAFALRLKTMTLPEAAEYFRREFGVQAAVEEICTYIDHMIADDYRFRAPLKEGVREMLDALRRQSVRMCVASATNHALVEAALKRLEVMDYFSFVLTCGDLNTSKNLPYIFDECARRLGTRKESTAVFEDSLHCVVTASRAGYPVVGVYDASAASEEQEIRSLSSCYIRAWKEFSVC